MSLNVQLPLEIIVKIAKFLYVQEYFAELESVIYTFPKLSQLFGPKFPTVVLIDDDQFDQFNKFIFPRTRPYGSKDLFIIKQLPVSKWTRISRLGSQLYIILGSKCYQELIPKEFERILGDWVSLVECSTMVDSSYKCYRLTWVPKEDSIYPSTYTKEDFRYSVQVGLLLNTFLSLMNIRMLRFESYSSKKDLYFEFEDMYDIYSSLNTAMFPKDDYFTSLLRRNDRELDTLKCSFEFVKDIETISKLYQYSNTNNPETLESYYGSFPYFVTRWLKHKLGYPDDTTLTTTAFFNNVKDDIVIDKIKSSKNFIMIDFSSSAFPNSFAFEFLQNHCVFTESTIQRRSKPQHHSMRDEDMLIKAGLKNIERNYVNYIDLFHRDFLIEKLIAADITAFRDSKKSTTISDSSNVLNLKRLECQINRLVGRIQELHNVHEGLYQREELCHLFSQNIMKTIVKQITNSIEQEGLDEEQPFRLRVFDNSTHRIDCELRYKYVKKWFHRKTNL